MRLALSCCLDHLLPAWNSPWHRAGRWRAWLGSELGVARSGAENNDGLGGGLEAAEERGEKEVVDPIAV
jgi:hypothetical protein